LCAKIGLAGVRLVTQVKPNPEILADRVLFLGAYQWCLEVVKYLFPKTKKRGQSLLFLSETSV